MAEHIGASWAEWKAEHGEPLRIEGALPVWADGSVTIDVGDGALRRLGAVIADDFESQPDRTGDRVAGWVALRLDPLATPVPQPGWADLAGEVTTPWRRVRTLERRLDELLGILEPLLASPFVDGPDRRYCLFCGEAEHADDCEVLRGDALVRRE